MMDLEDIKGRMEEISKKNIGIFKTVISLREDNAIQHGMMNKKAWKDLLEKTIVNDNIRMVVDNTTMTVTLKYSTGIERTITVKR